MNRFLSGLLAMTLALTACGGGDAEPAPSASASPSPSPSPSPEVSPTPSPEPSPTAAPSPSPSPPKASPSPPKPAPPPPGPAAPALATGPARAGQYLFNDTGEIRTLGCLTSNQAVPTPSRLNVQAPNGNRQQIDREQNGTGGPGFVTNIVFEYRDDGAFLVSLRQRQTFANQTVDLEFQADPPVLAIPSRPMLGQANSFTLRSTDGKVQVQTDTRIEGINEQVTLAQGAVVKAIRIRSSSRITGQSNQGSLNVAVDRTSWYAADSRLEVKDATDTSGSVGLCRVDFSVQSLAQAV